MKKAFTMIELIFVIIIIGVLSAIALPILNATRDDAKVSTILANLKNTINDSAAFYSARGEKEWIKATVDKVTNVPIFKDENCKKQATSTTTFVGNKLYMCNNNNSIIKLEANKTHMLIKKGKSDSLIAKEVYKSKVFNSLNYKNGIRLGGLAVKR